MGGGGFKSQLWCLGQSRTKTFYKYLDTVKVFLKVSRGGSKVIFSLNKTSIPPVDVHTVLQYSKI